MTADDKVPSCRVCVPEWISLKKAKNDQGLSSLLSDGAVFQSGTAHDKCLYLPPKILTRRQYCSTEYVAPPGQLRIRSRAFIAQREELRAPGPLSLKS